MTEPVIAIGDDRQYVTVTEFEQLIHEMYARALTGDTSLVERIMWHLIRSDPMYRYNELLEQQRQMRRSRHALHVLS